MLIKHTWHLVNCIQILIMLNLNYFYLLLCITIYSLIMMICQLLVIKNYQFEIRTRHIYIRILLKFLVKSRGSLGRSYDGLDILCFIMEFPVKKCASNPYCNDFGYLDSISKTKITKQTPSPSNTRSAQWVLFFTKWNWNRKFNIKFDK